MNLAQSPGSATFLFFFFVTLNIFLTLSALFFLASGPLPMVQGLCGVQRGRVPAGARPQPPPHPAQAGAPTRRCSHGNRSVVLSPFCPPRFPTATRVSDPDPHGSALIWVAWSGSAFISNCGSGSRRAKMTHKNRKKYRIFMFWSAGCFLLRAEGFSCSLGVLYGGLRIRKWQFFIKKINIKFPAVNLFQL